MGERGRVAALDGLRGAAILLVLVNHLGLPGLGYCGAVGVAVFFVLSGYLITGQLLAGLTLRDFYVRRAARLLPALLCMVTVVAVVVPAARWSVPLVVGYMANVPAMLGGGVADPFAHTWSLAVEEHFYLLWPVVLAVIPRRAVLPLALWGAVASLAVRFTVDFPHSYFGTDVNAYALLLGCALAAAPRALPPALWPLLVILTTAALSSDASRATVLPVVAALAAARVIAGPHPWLDTRPLVYLGRISYGLYLWHWPLVAWVDRPWQALAMMPVAVGVAAASWRFVERPIIERARRPAARPSAALPTPYPRQLDRQSP